MASHFEQTQKKLETLLQSSEKGKALFEDLRKFSFDTTFGVDELASAGSELINAGVAVSDLQKRLKMLGDIAGGNKAKFAELSSIYGKIILQGKAGSQVLSQFNLRGVPLNKTLQEMGVVGSASAEQVTKALEKLTAEGGQFHDAMNNIIDTIEGKQGFIDDTQKEILVNFGEMTGMTDAYKLALDVLYEILDKINNALMWINDNPLVKGLMAGIFTTAIVGLVHVILANLIPALTALIAKLTVVASLKSIINPASLIAGGVVAGIVAIVAALDDSADSAKELKNSIKDTVTTLDTELTKQLSITDELKEQVRLKRLLSGEADAGSDEKENISSEYQKAVDRVNYIKHTLESTQYDFDTLNEALRKNISVEDFNNKWWEYKRILTAYKNPTSKAYYELTDEQHAQYYDAKEFINKYKAPINELNAQLHETLQQEKALWDTNLAYENQYYDALNKLYEKSPLTKLYDQRDALTAEVKEIDELANIKVYKKDDKGNIQKDSYGNPVQLLRIDIDPEYKKTIDSARNYLKIQLLENENNIIKTRVDLKKSGMQDYQKALAEVFNFSDKEILDGFADTGAKAVEKFINDTNKKFERLEGIADVLGLDKLDIAKDKVDYIKDAIQTILESKDENGNYIWGLDENTVKLLEEYLEKTKNETPTTKDNYGNSVVKNGVSSVIQGSDVKNAIDGFQAGGIWGAVINVFIGALFKVIASLDGLDQALSPITEIMKNSKNHIKTLMLFTAVLGKVNKYLGKFMDIIGNILSFGLINKLSELYDETQNVTDAQEEEAERLRQLNDQYAALYDAMKEQEAYYLQKKMEINASTYKENITKVNDMILTPKGTFSTSPQDTILAMKHPEDLARSSAPIINIYNESNATVTAETRADGGVDIHVLSQAIASDFATGSNGWDIAYNNRTLRQQGKVYSI